MKPKEEKKYQGARRSNNASLDGTYNVSVRWYLQRRRSSAAVLLSASTQTPHFLSASSRICVRDRCIAPSDAYLQNEMSRRALSTASKPEYAWIAKVVSTVFALSPPSIAAARLAPFREAISPFVAFQAIRRLRDPRASLAFFEITREDFHVKHLEAVYQFMVENLCRAGQPVVAHKLLDKMLADGYSMNGVLLEVLVVCYTNEGELDVAMSLLDGVSENSCSVRIGVYNRVLDQLFKGGRLGDGIQFFNKLLNCSAVAPDTRSFNIVINGLCQEGDIDKAFEFFNDMGRFQCFPDTITHNILIQGCCKTNQLEKGRELLLNIQSNRLLLPNTVSYTSMVSGYCKKGDMKAALILFNEMVNSGIRPNNFTYNSLIDGYGKSGDMSSAISMYEKMTDNGCTSDVVTFTSLIDGYCRSGRVDDAVNIWNKMTDNCVRPNGYTFSVVINTLCKQNRLNDAHMFLMELIKRKDIVIRPFMFNPVVHGFCKVGNLDVANSIVAMMEGRRCFPDKITYTILITGHCMAGRTSDAMFIFYKMAAAGCSLDKLAIDSIIPCLLKAGVPREANRILSFCKGGVIAGTIM